MTTETSTAQSDDEQTDPETILSEQEYTVGESVGQVAEGIELREEVGDSEFEYVLVGSNLDDGSDRLAFGIHETEFPLRFPE